MQPLYVTRLRVILGCTTVGAVNTITLVLSAKINLKLPDSHAATGYIHLYQN